MKNILVVLILLTGVAGCSDGGGSGAPASTANTFYATKTPYRLAQQGASYEPPPQGFHAVFTQMLARHGSRALTSSIDIDYVKQLIDFAETDQALTRLGATLRPQVLSLEAANVNLGYGNLSGLGVEEHQALAVRLLERLQQLFHDAQSGGRHIQFITSGKDRAVDSAQNFEASISSHLPQLVTLIDATITDTHTLYFFKENKKYQEWLAHDPTLTAKLNQIYYSDRSHREARRILRRLFSASFVDELASGKFTFTNTKTGESVTLNEVDLAGSLYNLYQIAPGLRDEGTWQFSRFVPAGPAAWFAYLSDSSEFYEKGPSFAGSTITFGMAKVLEDDFVNAVGLNCNDSSPFVARLRFAHAETIIPLAALMELPRSNEQVPVSETYTYGDNPWRGDQVAPYAANMQWDSFSNNGGTCLVKMLYNEKETRFKKDCSSIRPGSFYYELGELKRCYGYQ